MHQHKALKTGWILLAAALCLVLPTILEGLDWTCPCCHQRFISDPKFPEYFESWKQTHMSACCGSGGGSGGGLIGALLRGLFGRSDSGQPGRTMQELRSQRGTDLNNMGVGYAKQGDHENAVKLYKKALRMSPKDSVIRNNIGHSLNEIGVQAFNGGDYRLAARVFDESLHYSPDNPIIRKNLAAAIARLGKEALDSNDFAGAKKMLADALSLDPDNQSMQASLKYIQERLEDQERLANVKPILGKMMEGFSAEWMRMDSSDSSVVDLTFLDPDKPILVDMDRMKGKTGTGSFESLGPAPDAPAAWGSPEEVGSMLKRDAKAAMDVSGYMQTCIEKVEQETKNRGQKTTEEFIVATLGPTGKVLTNIPKMEENVILPAISDVVNGKISLEEYSRKPYEAVTTLFNMGTAPSEILAKMIQSGSAVKTFVEYGSQQAEELIKTGVNNTASWLAGEFGAKISRLKKPVGPGAMIAEKKSRELYQETAKIANEWIPKICESCLKLWSQK